ncbi:MAG: 30S ribosomal protein THX [Pseudomonadota bacterium]|jgi:30S ribosomal protein S31|nr:30S ribosomal protein THX [Burkholderiaceae bacterium]MDQ3444669.1 30S ribosomal protein THX [Pseudomonadota bacterium]
MGKGDLRTRRGKIYNGSHGKKRPGRVKKAAPVTRAHAAPARTSSGTSKSR